MISTESLTSDRKSCPSSIPAIRQQHPGQPTPGINGRRKRLTPTAACFGCSEKHANCRASLRNCRASLRKHLPIRRPDSGPRSTTSCPRRVAPRVPPFALLRGQLQRRPRPSRRRRSLKAEKPSQHASAQRQRAMGGVERNSTHCSNW